MKWGLIRFDGLDEKFISKTIINIGDVLQMMALEKILFEKFNAQKKDIIYLNYYELSHYAGKEYLIVPINLLVMHDEYNIQFLSMPSKIIPVFLGISFSDTRLLSEQIEYLKKWQPIGCRDERTMLMLRRYGIEAYVQGCISITYCNKKENKKRNKIFLVDVPIEVEHYIPKELLQKCEIVKQEIYADPNDLPDHSIREYTEKIISKYSNEAEMIITSRFHGAVLGLSLGIPTIVTLEEYTYRFGWLSKFLPIYTKNSFKDIKWDIDATDVCTIQKQMLSVAVERICEVNSKYRNIYMLSEKLERGIDEEDENQQISLSASAIEYIDNTFKVDDKIKFSVWGINKNAEEIFEHLKKKYPEAKLVAAYDMFRKIDFHGIETRYPENFSEDEIIFVTAYIAAQIAPEIFKKNNIESSHYFLCSRNFIEEVKN